MTDPASTPPRRGPATAATTTLLVGLLAGLVVVGGAALSLSARPIVVLATNLGVPDMTLGSPTAAVVMVEGAVLFFTVLWLHPWTRRDVRGLSRVGAVAGLCLSSAAGVVTYGPAGCIPALVYAFTVHTWSRAVLSHLDRSTPGADTASTSLRGLLRREARHDEPAAAIEAGTAAPVGDTTDDPPTAQLSALTSTGARKRTRQELDAAARELPEQHRVTRKADDPLPEWRARVEAAEKAAREDKAVSA